jgi:hypothetical protein
VIPSDVRDRSRRTSRAALGYGVAAVLYLIGSVAFLWHAWSRGVSTHTVIPSGDPALFIWSFAFAEKSLAHLQLPLTTSLLFHPHGFNVLANTTSLGIAVPFAPLTWLAGPVVSMNVALTIAPVVSGLAMVCAARCHHVWWPAAIAAGGIWALSPFMLYGLNAGWLMIVYLAGPPLLWALLHELLVTRRRSPYVIGLTIAILCVWQFWIGSEILAIMVSVGVPVSVCVLVAQARAAGPDRVAVLVHVAKGVAVAAVLTVAVLVAPALYSLHGPAHLGTWVWPRWTFYHDVTALSEYVTGATTGSVAFFVTLTGSVPNLAFVGFGIPLVLLLGLCIAVRNWVLWLLAVLVALGVLLGLAGRLVVSPFQLVYRLPILHNILPYRWIGIVVFAGALGVGIGTTELVAWARTRTRFATLGGAALLALAVVPVLVTDAAFAPLPVAPVSAPSWFRTHHGGVLLMTPTVDSIASGS